MIKSISNATARMVGAREADFVTEASRMTSEMLPEDQRIFSSYSSDQHNISILARQLSESAARAEVRDKTLSRAELAAKAKSIVNLIVGDAYSANKARNDSEVPKSSVAELVARAKLATEYVNDAAKGGHSVKNPFAGLSPEQLANIAYDESGTFTVNERQAAWREAYDLEEAWRVKVVTKAIDEYNQTGKLTNFFTSVLDHFKKLPAIEQAQYPKNYASDLEYKIKLNFNYRTHRIEGKDETPTSLIEMLLLPRPSESTERV